VESANRAGLKGAGKMHLQTASSPVTNMALPTLPASPTLTNPDMILPYGEYVFSRPPQTDWDVWD